MSTARHSLRPGGWLQRVMTFCMALTAAAGLLSGARADYANPDGVAVVIGNRTYAEGIPEVTFAHRDADAFTRYVVEVLGFDPENVIDLRDATQAQMWSTFGSRASADRSDLWAYLDPAGSSDVVVYYSGHGAPGIEDKRGYLLPVDADPNTAELNGYPIDVLYRNLSGLDEARSVTVFVDACFSGGSGGGMLIDSASPVYVTPAMPETAGERLAVLTAATGKQLASWDREAGHGLFTHHLLDALHGAGDANADGEVTAREAKAYLDRHMTRAARRTFKRRQNASLVGNADTVLASAGVGGAFPVRPELDASEADSVAVVSEDDGTGESDAVEEPSSPPPSVEDAESVEQALGLTHAQRVLVQRGLSALGFEVGTADGLFGRRTREGIAGHQREKGLPETGYLRREQFEALKAVGEEAHRAEVVRVERERQEAEAKRQEAERRAEAARRADDEAFARAKSEGTAESYASYLDAYPSGRHAREARRLRDEAAGRERGSVVGERFRDCDGTWCPELVVVPAGSFMMGSPASEKGRNNGEGPVHRVRIAQPFAVGVYEVTFDEWDACVRDGGCGGHRPRDEGWGRGRRPVINVSWEDAQSYVGWLSRKTGEKYRLLSESEWEYVARGGTTGPFHFGATISTDEANYDGGYTYGSGREGVYRGQTVPVGRFPANEFGLHDVHGNVSEWVEDCWNGSYAGAPADGGAWETGGCRRRVLRGGSWLYEPRDLRSANRSWNSAGPRYDSYGFRVARTLTP